MTNNTKDTPAAINKCFPFNEILRDFAKLPETRIIFIHLSSTFIATLTQRINSFFSSSQELRQLSGKVRQLRAYQLHYERIAPPSLLRASHVSQMELGTLTLTANNNAVAAKLRQMTPELTRQLQLQGCEVTGIQVRVQVAFPPHTHSVLPSTLSDMGRHELSELADSMDDSPLKTALQRLAEINKKKQAE